MALHQAGLLLRLSTLHGVEVTLEHLLLWTLLLAAMALNGKMLMFQRKLLERIHELERERLELERGWPAIGRALRAVRNEPIAPGLSPASDVHNARRAGTRDASEGES